MKITYLILFISFLLALSPLTVSALEEPQQVSNSSITAMININQATAVELSTLKGIGLKKAEAIIQYRDNYGEFKDVNDLQNVKGIGAKFIEKNAKYLSI